MNIQRANISGRGVQFHKGSLRWSYGKGYSYSDRVRGSYDDVEAMFPVLTKTYDDLELTQDGDSNRWTVIATYGGDEDPIHTFSIRKVSFQQSVFRNPLVVAGVGGTRNLSVVRSYWEKIISTRTLEANEEAWVQATGGISTSSSFRADQVEFALDLLDELNQDATSFLTTSYILAHQTVLSRRDLTVAANFDNINRIYTREQLIAEEKFSGDATTIPNKQWLKQAPDVEYTLGQRKMISTEYLAADTWSTLQYALYEAPE